MKKAERLGHVQAWGQSGMSKPAYCREHGLKYGTFMSWFKLKADASESGRFVALPETKRDVAVRIIFPNGIEVSYMGKLDAELIKTIRNA